MTHRRQIESERHELAASRKWRRIIIPALEFAAIVGACLVACLWLARCE